MQENITYRTPEGLLHKVLMVDEINKQVYINIIGTLHRWVHENEYRSWVINDTAEMPKIYVPDIPEQMTEEQINSQSKIEQDAIPEQIADEVHVFSEARDGEEMGSGNTEPEITTEQENENTGQEEVVKKKRVYKKKQ